MSDEETRDMKENGHSSDDEQIEDMESGIELSSSNYSDLSQDSDHDFENYAEEGTEIQPQDVLVIDDLPVEFSGETLDENIASPAFYEFLTAFDDENCSRLLESYFDDTDSFPADKKDEIPDEIQPPKALEKRKDERAEYLFGKNQGTTALENNTGLTKRSEYTENMNTVKELGEKGVPHFEMQRMRCDEKSSFFPVTELPLAHDGINQVKCPEYTSDEFADIEDNAKDSSSSDNNDYPSMLNTTKSSPLKGLLPHVKSSQGQISDERKTFKKDLTSSSSSENNVDVDKSCVPSLPGTSKKNCEFPGNYFSQNNCKDIKKVQTTKTSNEGKKMFKVSMSTILELPEAENDGKSSKTFQPSVSKNNNLKMKARVGNRKDKCNICNVRLGLCAIKCRCGGYYCAKHRYDKEHDCSFDYKSMGAEEIRKNNPRVVAEKVRKL